MGIEPTDPDFRRDPLDLKSRQDTSPDSPPYEAMQGDILAHAMVCSQSLFCTPYHLKGPKLAV